MSWIATAAATAGARATADVLVKIAAGRIAPSLGLLLYGCTTFAVGTAWVVLEKARRGPLEADPVGVAAALAVGLAFAAVTVGLYASFGAGAPVSGASPLIRLGGLVLASAFGVAAFGEPLTVRYAAGIVLVLVGVALMVLR